MAMGRRRKQAILDKLRSGPGPHTYDDIASVIWGSDINRWPPSYMTALKVYMNYLRCDGHTITNVERKGYCLGGYCFETGELLSPCV